MDDKRSILWYFISFFWSLVLFTLLLTYQQVAFSIPMFSSPYNNQRDKPFFWIIIMLLDLRMLWMTGTMDLPDISAWELSGKWKYVGSPHTIGDRRLEKIAQMHVCNDSSWGLHFIILEIWDLLVTLMFLLVKYEIRICQWISSECVRKNLIDLAPWFWALHNSKSCYILG